MGFREVPVGVFVDEAWMIPLIFGLFDLQINRKKILGTETRKGYFNFLTHAVLNILTSKNASKAG